MKVTTTLFHLVAIFALNRVSSAPTSESEEYALLVEKAAASLTDDVLADDSLLLQEVVSDHSIYRHDKTEKHGAPIFIRKGNDGGKSVVVFREGDDFLPQCNKKKTFVVLKQVGKEKNQYRVFFAYVKISPTDNTTTILEWDIWSPRGNVHNKALSFGFIRCRRSNMVPCKKELQLVTDDTADYEDFTKGAEITGVIMPPLPYVHPVARLNPDGGPDYWCDLLDFGDMDKRFIGTLVGSLTQAMAILSGAEIVYKDEVEVVKEVHEEIKKAAVAQTAKGRSLGPTPSANDTGAAAEKLVNIGRSTVAGATMLFYAGVVKLGALAINEVPVHERPPGGLDEAKLEDLALVHKGIGMNILRSLFRGADIDDPAMKGATPNPQLLLNENTVADLVAGRSVGESIAGNAQQGRNAQGRGMFHWLFGGADVGTSSSNGEQAIRQYTGVQKDGSVTGSKGVDNLNFAIDNAFGGSKKSAGQIFSENIIAGVYAPNGIIEDVADALSGSVLGAGKVSDDRSYIDDLLDKTLNVVAGAGGQIVDVVGDILGPIGLGGLWNGVAGVGAAFLGGAGAVLASPVMGVYNLVKVGAKALGIGGIIGMQGSTSRAANEGGNQNTQRDSGPQLGATYGEVVGKKRRKRAAIDLFNKHLDIQARTDVDLFSNLGWRTAEIKQADLAKATFKEDVPFTGFGKCVYKPTSSSDFDGVKSGKEAAKLYFQTMRTSCVKDQVDSFNELIMEGYVKFNGDDKTFSVPEGHAILKKTKLSQSETNALGKAFEMATYSKNYVLAGKKPPPQNGTRTAATLQSMVLLYLEDAARLAPNHYVKLTRNVGKLVKTAFTKSLQDFFRYKYCRKCPKQHMRDIMHDCILFSALLDFVLKEQDHPAYKGKSKEEAFKKHFDWAGESTANKMLKYFV